MSPIQDPRFSGSRWSETLEKDRQAAERAGKLEYIKPLIMLVVGGGIVMTALAAADAEIGGAGATAAAAAATMYPIVLAIEVVFGIIGLLIASYLFLGGAGPLGLAVLRLAGIYAAVDCVAVIASPLMFLSWIIQGVLYIGLLAWLFELEFTDTLLLAVITFVLKIVAGFAVIAAFV